MDYEKKYKNLLAKAKEFEFQGYIDEECLYDMFPELREESERIRKALIKYYSFDKDGGSHALDNITPKQIVAWLEKQGKNNMGISEATEQKLEDNLHKALEKETPESCNEFLEKQGELQKHDVCDNCEQQGSCVFPCPMKLVEKQGEPTDINPSEFDLRLNKLLKQFETLPKEELASSLSFYLNIVQNDGTYKEENQGEQKSAFKMKTPEESLGIDSDIYNKIVDECIYGEQKPDWSEEDTQYINDTLALLSFGCSTHSVGEVKEWLQSLNNRVQPKQEWSEKDEINLKKAIWYVENPAPMVVKDSMLVEWLKSLKHQNTWKPSDEQMNALSVAVKHGQTDDPDALKKLLEQLKKLR